MSVNLFLLITFLLHKIQLFIKPAIQERGGGAQGMQGMRGRGMFEKIPGNVQEDPGECSKKLRGMLIKVLRNVTKDSSKMLLKNREKLNCVRKKRSRSGRFLPHELKSPPN